MRDANRVGSDGLEADICADNLKCAVRAEIGAVGPEEEVGQAGSAVAVCRRSDVVKCFLGRCVVGASEECAGTCGALVEVGWEQAGISLRGRLGRGSGGARGSGSRIPGEAIASVHFRANGVFEGEYEVQHVINRNDPGVPVRSVAVRTKQVTRALSVKVGEARSDV